MQLKLSLVFSAAGVLLGGGAVAKGPQAVEALDIDLFYQYSATDDDAEVTTDIESDEAIAFLWMVAPGGHTVAIVHSKDRLGLREIEVESDEPSVGEVQAAYPEGNYWFWGRAVSGVGLYGRVALSHGVPAAPDFFNFSPCDEVVDATGAVTMAWNAAPGADGGYEIIIEQDDTGGNLRLTLGVDATTFTIPDAFLAAGLEYEIEMKSVSSAGNKTSTSCGFSTL